MSSSCVMRIAYRVGGAASGFVINLRLRCVSYDATGRRDKSRGYL